MDDLVDKEADLAALGDPPAQPVAPHILFEDLTAEGMVSHFEHGQPSIGIISDEGGIFFGGHAMRPETRLMTATFLSKLWEGAPLTRSRAKVETITFLHRRATMHLMIQPIVAEDVLADQVLVGQGWLGRTLIVWPESRIGTRIRNEDPSQVSQPRRDAATALGDFHGRIQALLERGPWDVRESSPRVLALSMEAKARLLRFHNDVEEGQLPGGPFEAITTVASKASQQAARLAGIMTLFEDTEADEITPGVMADAIALIEWYLAEAKRLLATGPISDKIRDAEILRTWLVDRRREPVISLRDIARFGPNQLRETARIRLLMTVLEAHNWVIPAPGTVIAGRAVKEAWRVVRP